MNGGFLYLVAVMDWYSRYVLSWELSNTLDNTFCINALERALENHGQPDIFNSDQGCQFTSNDFTGLLLEKRIRISMDGKGRALDNIYVERLWRSVKYEEVYLSDYQCGRETYEGLNVTSISTTKVAAISHLDIELLKKSTSKERSREADMEPT